MLKSKKNVYWVTGVSGSGKSTFANILKKELEEKKINSILIDGDEIRKLLNDKYSYTKDDRLEVARIYSKLAKLISEQGVTTIVSTISLFNEIHEWNRENISGYKEILIKRDMNDILRDDKKLVYKNNNVVGNEIPAEYPKNPEFIVENIKKNEINKYIKEFILK
jgi:cytidine diphosphoramidate kinase